MEYFTIQGATPREALATMKRMYGPDARIHSHRAVRMGGVLGLFARQGVEITGFVEPSDPERATPEVTDLDDERRKILHRAAPGSSLHRLADEVAALRSRLDASFPDGAPVAPPQTGHPQLDALDALLLRNDFASHVRLRLIDQVRAEFPLSQLEDVPAVHQYVARRIGSEVRLAAPLAEAVGAAAGPRICTVVGPTGVGKTTTVAKLAALHAIGGSGESSDCRVRIVTIDNYRIGARQQIETYGEIMRIPVTAAETADELKKAIALGQDADLIFIDTVGRSPGDYSHLAEIRSLLDAVGRQGTTQLVVSATTKYADLEEIMRQIRAVWLRWCDRYQARRDGHHWQRTVGSGSRPQTAFLLLRWPAGATGHCAGIDPASAPESGWVSSRSHAAGAGIWGRYRIRSESGGGFLVAFRGSRPGDRVGALVMQDSALDSLRICRQGRDRMLTLRRISSTVFTVGLDTKCCNMFAVTGRGHCSMERWRIVALRRRGRRWLSPLGGG